MKKLPLFNISPGWKLLLSDIGIDPIEILKRAELPADLFALKDAKLTTKEYFRLWQSMEVTFDNPSFPLELIKNISTEIFDPPVFSAYCSQNLNQALKRLSKFKPLIGPVKLDIEATDESTKLTLRFMEKELEPPIALIGAELSFFVQLARMASREYILPIQVITPCEIPDIDLYSEYFGVTPVLGKDLTVVFSAEDAQKPFLSENPQMWEFFEPGLRKRLSEISIEEGMTERVSGALLEMLPSGESNMGELANRLLVSRRTLQRRLGEEGTNYKEVLSGVREKLARHYITNSELPYTQISFLLGYENPNSFFRAFQSWTGTTPDTIRSQIIH